MPRTNKVRRVDPDTRGAQPYTHATPSGQSSARHPHEYPGPGPGPAPLPPLGQRHGYYSQSGVTSTHLTPYPQSVAGQNLNLDQNQLHYGPGPGHAAPAPPPGQRHHDGHHSQLGVTSTHLTPYPQSAAGHHPNLDQNQNQLQYGFGHEPAPPPAQRHAYPAHLTPYSQSFADQNLHQTQLQYGPGPGPPPGQRHGQLAAGQTQHHSQLQYGPVPRSHHPTNWGPYTEPAVFQAQSQPPHGLGYGYGHGDEHGPGPVQHQYGRGYALTHELGLLDITSDPTLRLPSYAESSSQGPSQQQPASGGASVDGSVHGEEPSYSGIDPHDRSHTSGPISQHDVDNPNTEYRESSIWAEAMIAAEQPPFAAAQIVAIRGFAAAADREKTKAYYGQYGLKHYHCRVEDCRESIHRKNCKKGLDKVGLEEHYERKHPEAWLFVCYLEMCDRKGKHGWHAIGGLKNHVSRHAGTM